MYPRWLWPITSLPGLLWLGVFFIMPLYAIVAVAFGGVDPIFQTPQPVWNPLSWNTGFVHETLIKFLPGREFSGVLVRTFLFVGVSLAGCVAIGYPVAYYVARHAGRRKGILLALIVLPFWVSYLMRMLAWISLLSPTGYINRFLVFAHVISAPYGFLDGHASTVIWALIYGYIPYFILPLYASLDRIDRSVLEAARDLGATPARTFLHVILPLSSNGLLAGTVLVALPMFGDYYTTTLVSGSPRTTMIGNQIDFYFHGGPQPTVGAAITIVLSLVLGVLMAYYLRSVRRGQLELAR